MNTISVIKIGGGEGIDPLPLLDEIAERTSAGERFVLVHGGSHETNVVAERLGHPPRFLTSPGGHSSRRTDRTTLEIFEMVYCGKVNKHLVEQFQRRGVNAVGLSGLDGGIWRGRRKDAIRAVEEGRTVIIRDDLSGRVERVDSELLSMLLDSGRLPVLTPPALADEGIAINVDADRAAAATAIALRAEELLLLSNVPGVMRDPTDWSSLIGHVGEVGIEAIRKAATGRMKNKVLAAEEAHAGGVGRVVIGSANRERPIASARTGQGTVFEGVPA
ncbi:MAG: [LysW]-aminoadipate kinase [Phycisphaeraceae bacterium]|nr:[LysW]-aminoadipate kinase [Phycisphaeraceae bacterium]